MGTRRGDSNEYPQSLFWAEKWKILRVLSESFQFLEVKFSIYLNRRVFVMRSHKWCESRDRVLRTSSRGYHSCRVCIPIPNYIQSTLVISNSKGLSEILRDIRSSTYQVCRIEEKIIWLTTFNKLIGNWTFEVRDILKILWKRGEIAPLFYNIFHLLLGFHV